MHHVEFYMGRDGALHTRHTDDDLDLPEAIDGLPRVTDLIELNALRAEVVRRAEQVSRKLFRLAYSPDSRLAEWDEALDEVHMLEDTAADLYEAVEDRVNAIREEDN
jgi:hypothetical protein